jgi:hypothetical protein
MDVAYGGMKRVPVSELLRLHRSVVSMSRLPRLLGSAGSPPPDETEYLGHIERLIRSIVLVSGARTIVDLSKLPSFCCLLGRIGVERSRLVHLVRDSRAVAFSFMRRKRKPDVTWTEAYMRRLGPLRSSFDWNVLNVGAAAVARSTESPVFLRYEDLAREPEAGIASIDAKTAASLGPSLRLGTVSLGENHSVSGNPVRFTTGELSISPDEEWQTAMASSDRRLVTAMTWPLLARYGYLDLRPARSGSPVVSGPGS